MTSEEWLHAHGVTQSDLESWGVQCFSDRFVIPVHTVAGTPAFTMTRHLNREPKYVFAPSECRRGAVLYGLHRAAAYMARTRRAVLVEGFADTIACHLGGVQEAVGVMGSGMSRTQEALLSCFADTAVLLMDGDAAGEDAARKTVGRCTQLRVIGATIKGVDPSEMRAGGHNLVRAVETAYTHASRYQYIGLERDGTICELVER